MFTHAFRTAARPRLRLLPRAAPTRLLTSLRLWFGRGSKKRRRDTAVVKIKPHRTERSDAARRAAALGKRHPPDSPCTGRLWPSQLRSTGHKAVFRQQIAGCSEWRRARVFGELPEEKKLELEAGR